MTDRAHNREENLPFVGSAAKPFLRWAGSKRKTLSKLSALWRESHVRYVEPFAGSACLFFKIAPQRAVLGDSNTALIATYRAVKRDPDTIHRRLVAIPRNSDTYYRWRSINPRTLDDDTNAVRFLYLNRNCFNGIYRTNMNGDFNVPFGRKVGANITRSEMKRCSELLRGAQLVSGDFSVTLKKVQAGDFVYLDPPFALTSRRMFRQYGKKPFSTDDVPRLSDELSTIVRRGADFLLSYADCSEARGIAKLWNAKKLSVRRNIAGFAGDRAQAYEWMISNLSLKGVESHQS